MMVRPSARAAAMRMFMVAAHGDHVQVVDLRSVQAAGGGGGVDEAVLHLDSRAHGGEALEMLVDGTHAQVTAAGVGTFAWPSGPAVRR